MHDVVGDVVVATGDPHLVANEPVPSAESVLTIGHGAGADVAETGPGLWLRQAHRPEPTALDLWPGERVDLRHTAESRDQTGVRDRQHRVSGGRDVGGRKLREQRRLHKVWQRHAAQGLREARGVQPDLRVLVQGGAYGGQHVHAGLVQRRLMAVGVAVMRQEPVACAALGEFEYGIDRVTRHGLAAARRQ